MHDDILEFLNTHLETGRLAAWDSEEISVDESSVIIFSNNCTLFVEVVHFCGRTSVT